MNAVILVAKHSNLPKKTRSQGHGDGAELEMRNTEKNVEGFGRVLAKIQFSDRFRIKVVAIFWYPKTISLTRSFELECSQKMHLSETITYVSPSLAG